MAIARAIMHPAMMVRRARVVMLLEMMARHARIAGHVHLRHPLQGPVAIPALPPTRHVPIRAVHVQQAVLAETPSTAEEYGRAIEMVPVPAVDDRADSTVVPTEVVDAPATRHAQLMSVALPR
jgi:hypothetical protein